VPSFWKEYFFQSTQAANMHALPEGGELEGSTKTLNPVGVERICPLSSELMLHIKQKTGHGVWNPLPMLLVQ